MSFNKRLFTLRGHNAGVTALDQHEQYIISGDEEGCIIVWDLMVMRRCSFHANIFQSRIQAIRTVSDEHIAIQTRDHGIYILKFASILISDPPDLGWHIDSYPSIFSRMTVLKSDGGLSLIAFASPHDSTKARVLEISTNRFIDAIRPDNRCTVFDIHFKVFPTNDECEIYVAYEDGHLAIYQVNGLQSSEKLSILHKRIIDVGFRDFVSAFDIVGDSILIVGGPTRNLVFYNTESDIQDEVRLNSRGVSSIAKTNSQDLIAVARWSKLVQIYSTSAHSLLCTIESHDKQIHDMRWLESVTEIFPEHNLVLCCASHDGTISITGLNAPTCV